MVANFMLPTHKESRSCVRQIASFFSFFSLSLSIYKKIKAKHFPLWLNAQVVPKEFNSLIRLSM